MYKNIKVLTSLVIAVCLLLSTAPAVSAAETGNFKDVKFTDWFYSDVRQLVYSGAIGGYPDGTFRPSNHITRAEYVKILVTAVKLTITSGDYFTDTAAHWADKYIDTAVREGIIFLSDYPGGFSPDIPITRYEMALMACRAANLFDEIYESKFADINDVNVNRVVKAGIINGYLEKGTWYFRGEQLSLRSEASAVIMRLMRYMLPAEARELSDRLVLDDAQTYTVDTTDRLIRLFEVTTRRCITSFRVKVGGKCVDWLTNYMNLFYTYNDRYYTGGIGLSYWEIKPEIYEIVLTYATPKNEILAQMAEVDTHIARAIPEIITPEMGPLEKARAIHDYIMAVTDFDWVSYNAGEIPINSLTAYGALIEGKAVCQGYAAAFDAMCKAVGVKAVSIPCSSPGADFENHMINAVLVDNFIYYFDTTWDDTETNTSNGTKYMLQDEAQMKKHGYKWDLKWVDKSLFVL